MNNEPKVVPIYDSNIIAKVTADLSERVIWLEFDVQEEGRKALIQIAMLEGESRALRDQLDAAERDIVAHHSRIPGHSDHPEPASGRFIDVVFDGPPSHESGRFVEVEDAHGKSITIGQWVDRGNGLWALRIEVSK